jgi:guanine deaminase
MQAFRAALLRFAEDGTALYDEDGFLLVRPDASGRQVVRAAGPWQALAPSHPGVAVEHLPGRLLVPGFIDLHVHFPQTDVIGSPSDGLLPWLETYTFPHEARFADSAYASGVAKVFLDELLRHGVTTPLAFATSHPASVDALMEEAQARGMRLIAGKVLQDRHSPDGVRDETEQSLLDTEALLQRWHGRRGSHPAAARPSCVGRESWRRATRIAGSSPMSPRTRTRSAGRASCSRMPAAIWRCTRDTACCGRGPSTPTASTSMTTTAG